MYERDADVILQGMLLCPSDTCQREYPIIDGIPLIIANLRGYIGEHIYQLLARDDLPEAIESVLGDCSGPGSWFDVTRHHLGSYARDHYGAYDPEETDANPPPGGTVRLLSAGLTRVAKLPAGPLIDLGCSVGGATLKLAERADDPQQLVLGVDMNLSMLRVAASAIYRGTVQYPRRRTGVVYDRRRLSIDCPRAEYVDFWACDVLALPFADSTFALAAVLNVLDSVRSPRDLLAEAARVLAADGKAIVTSPYDWSAAHTPIEAWLGGHSQRGPNRGASEPVLRSLLWPSNHPAAVSALELADELLDVPWHVRLHDRSSVEYRVHLVVAKKRA